MALTYAQCRAIILERSRDMQDWQPDPGTFGVDADGCELADYVPFQREPTAWESGVAFGAIYGESI